MGAIEVSNWPRTTRAIARTSPGERIGERSTTIMVASLVHRGLARWAERPYRPGSARPGRRPVAAAELPTIMTASSSIRASWSIIEDPEGRHSPSEGQSNVVMSRGALASRIPTAIPDNGTAPETDRCGFPITRNSVRFRIDSIDFGGHFPPRIVALVCTPMQHFDGSPSPISWAGRELAARPWTGRSGWGTGGTDAVGATLGR